MSLRFSSPIFVGDTPTREANVAVCWNQLKDPKDGHWVHSPKFLPYQQEGEAQRSSDFPSNPELSQVSKFSPNWATQPAKKLCPRGQGSEVRQLLPQKGSGPL